MAADLAPGASDEELMRRLGLSEVPAEGRFFPDTYMYGKGSSDVAVLRRAMKAMDTQLAQAWAQRDMGLPLQNPQEALILKSCLIEPPVTKSRKKKTKSSDG
jgi:UPF0755 protein